ncbi:hypothetical protein ACXWTF_13060 [Thiomicrolovo sp. ZZH C-3]
MAVKISNGLAKKLGITKPTTDAHTLQRNLQKAQRKAAALQNGGRQKKKTKPAADQAQESGVAVLSRVGDSSRYILELDDGD